MPRKLTLLSFAKKHKESKKEPDKSIIKFLKKLKKGSLLILPAGAGFEANYAQKKGFSVTAIDDDIDLIKQARAMNSSIDLNYSTFFAFAKKLSKNQFDYVVDNGYSQTLHRDKLPRFYKSISRILKHNGRLMTRALSTSDEHCKKHCPQRQWTYSDGRYINFFNKGFLLDILRKSGFNVENYQLEKSGHTYHIVKSSLKLTKL